MRRAWNHALSQARLRRRRRWGVLFFGVFVFGPWPARSQCRIYIDYPESQVHSCAGFVEAYHAQNDVARRSASGETRANHS